MNKPVECLDTHFDRVVPTGKMSGKIGYLGENVCPNYRLIYKQATFIE